MINPKELRLGNWIYAPFLNQNVEVVGLPLTHEYEIEVQIEDKDGNTYILELEALYPIELTEELLLEECDWLVMRNSEDAILEYWPRHIPPVKVTQTDGGYLFNNSSKPFHFLHQLQNKVFYHSDIELEINL